MNYEKNYKNIYKFLKISFYEKNIYRDLYRLFRKCERINYEIYSEWLRHKDKIKSGDYSDDDIEAIIRTTLNDVDVHNLSKWIQIIKYENWGERL